MKILKCLRSPLHVPTFVSYVGTCNACPFNDRGFPCCVTPQFSVSLQLPGPAFTPGGSYLDNWLDQAREAASSSPTPPKWRRQLHFPHSTRRPHPALDGLGFTNSGVCGVGGRTVGQGQMGPTGEGPLRRLGSSLPRTVRQPWVAPARRGGAPAPPVRRSGHPLVQGVCESHSGRRNNKALGSVKCPP